MESDVSLAQNWRSRRFFLSNIRSAPRLFCCNTSNGFTFGEINLDVSAATSRLSLRVLGLDERVAMRVSRSEYESMWFSDQSFVLVSRNHSSTFSTTTEVLDLLPIVSHIYINAYHSIHFRIGFTSLSTSDRSPQTTAIYQNSDTAQSSPALKVNSRFSS